MATARKQKAAAKSRSGSARASAKVIRQRKAIELKVQGLSIREIAVKLGVTKSQAHRDVEAVLAYTKEESATIAELARKVALEQIDRAIVSLAKRIKKGDVGAVMAFCRLDERRAKLLHLEKTKVEHTGADGAPLPQDARSELIERLAGLVASAEAGGTAGAGTGEGSSPAQAEGAPSS